jgi:A/G-specific adenine glycosylase
VPDLDDPAARLAAIHPALLAWYRAGARPLAWRATRDPWRILVSEIMLQQTQAARVEPLWTAFCERFPTPRACAEAPLAEVLTRWRGLGYNRRAVNLHRTAQAIVEAHGGRVPDDLDELRALPGIGDYTARAVLAFAHGADAGPVDTNIARVLTRAVVGESLGRAALQRLADDAVPPGDGHDWSQALMDLGARVCTARAVRCADCPIAHGCAWRGDAATPDPAGGGAARVRPQAPFRGSDRYHRGRLVDALRDGPIPAAAVPLAADTPDGARAEALVAGLVADGLAEWSQGSLRLPT